MAARSVTKERVRFMDGPFAVHISAAENDLLEIAFLHKGAVKQSAEASVRGLLENAITVSQQVLASCQRRSWTDRDVSNLEAAAQRGVEALRSLKGPA
jgi:hypothetical protein